MLALSPKKNAPQSLDRGRERQQLSVPTTSQGWGKQLRRSSTSEKRTSKKMQAE
jgi:hypothetical protein